MIARMSASVAAVRVNQVGFTAYAATEPALDYVAVSVLAFVLEANA